MEALARSALLVTWPFPQGSAISVSRICVRHPYRQHQPFPLGIRFRRLPARNATNHWAPLFSFLNAASHARGDGAGEVHWQMQSRLSIFCVDGHLEADTRVIAPSSVALHVGLDVGPHPAESAQHIDATTSIARRGRWVKSLLSDGSAALLLLLRSGQGTHTAHARGLCCRILALGHGPRREVYLGFSFLRQR